MPRSPQVNEQLRAATFERLLDAALTCFARDGFASTTVRAIAAQAGLSTGLLYAHVPSKEALLTALFARSMQQVRATFAEALSASHQDSLAALVRAAVATVDEHRAFWQLSYAVRTQPDVVRVLGPELEVWHTEIMQTLEAICARHGAHHPSLDALALFAQIDGLCQHFALAPGDYPVHEVAACVIRRWSLPT